MGGIFVAEYVKVSKTHQLSTAGAQRWAKMFRAAARFVSGRSFEDGDFFAHQRRGRWYRRPLRFNRAFWDPEPTPPKLWGWQVCQHVKAATSRGANVM